MSGTPSRGNFFEDFRKGQLLRHPIPRTVTDGDAALYTALTGDRRPLHCAATFAQELGYPRESIHDLLTFHIVFGKTVGQVSLNAVANLGYADVRFLRPVYAGDTLVARSEVLGTKEVSSGKAGIVWVRTIGQNQRGEDVLRYIRWVMVEKRDPGTPTGAADAPDVPKEVPADELTAPPGFDGHHSVAWATGGTAFWEDYTAGQRIDHADGMTIDETDHTMATRLYQNTARVHFNHHVMASSRFGKRLMYGGHVISVAYALAYNGLENAVAILAWNGGSHVNPTFAGDTLYAWSEVLDKAPLDGRDDAGAVRIKLCAAKNVDPSKEPVPDGQKVLELDAWLLVLRRR